MNTHSVDIVSTNACVYEYMCICDVNQNEQSRQYGDTLQWISHARDTVLHCKST